MVAVRERSQPLWEVGKGFSEELNNWLPSKGRVDNTMQRGVRVGVAFSCMRD